MTVGVVYLVLCGFITLIGFSGNFYSLLLVLEATITVEGAIVTSGGE